MAQIVNNNGDLSFGSLVNFLTEESSKIEDRFGSSLFQYTRRTIINSRVFIDDTLRGEDILNPLMMNLMNLYAGLILTAINVDRQVTSTKTVRDSLSVVATEDYKVEFANDLMSKYFKGCSIRSTMADPVVTPADPNAAAPADDENGSDGKKKKGESTPADHDPQRNTETEYRTKEFMNDVPIPSGRIVQVTFDHKDYGKFNVNLLIQLSPIYVPTDVSQQFIAIHFKPSISQRWLQMTAGEISFFTDFLLGNDLRRKRLDALRKDKTGILSEMIDRKENAMSNMWMKISQVTPSRQNIANTILIYDDKNFAKACSSNGINFKNYANRQKFFNSTMSMIVVVVNPMYNRVDMYFNGMQHSSTFTFDQLKKNAKTEATDILAMMKQYANNGMIKF